MLHSMNMLYLYIITVALQWQTFVSMSIMRRSTNQATDLKSLRLKADLIVALSPGITRLPLHLALAVSTC